MTEKGKQKNRRASGGRASDGRGAAPYEESQRVVVGVQAVDIGINGAKNGAGFVWVFAVEFTHGLDEVDHQVAKAATFVDQAGSGQDEELVGIRFQKRGELPRFVQRGEGGRTGVLPRGDQQIHGRNLHAITTAPVEPLNDFGLNLAADALSERINREKLRRREVGVGSEETRIDLTKQVQTRERLYRLRFGPTEQVALPIDHTSERRLC